MSGESPDGAGAISIVDPYELTERLLDMVERVRTVDAMVPGVRCTTTLRVDEREYLLMIERKPMPAPAEPIVPAAEGSA